MKIRPATEEDAEAVAALWTEAYSGVSPEGRQAPYAAADLAASSRHGRAFVAEREGEVVGVVVLQRPGSPDAVVAVAGEAELWRLAVTPGARGGGIGRALTELCGERARELGARAVALYSRPYQTEAHRLYESCGYRRDPRRDSVDAGGGRRLVFVLELGTGP
jgi:ribosomal protein S18 acetylase RimI-like enzyme